MKKIVLGFLAVILLVSLIPLNAKAHENGVTLDGMFLSTKEFMDVEDVTDTMNYETATYPYTYEITFTNQSAYQSFLDNSGQPYSIALIFDDDPNYSDYRTYKINKIGGTSDTVPTDSFAISTQDDKYIEINGIWEHFYSNGNYGGVAYPDNPTYDYSVIYGGWINTELNNGMTKLYVSTHTPVKYFGYGGYDYSTGTSNYVDNHTFWSDDALNWDIDTGYINYGFTFDKFSTKATYEMPVETVGYEYIVWFLNGTQIFYMNNVGSADTVGNITIPDSVIRNNLKDGTNTWTHYVYETYDDFLNSNSLKSETFEFDYDPDASGTGTADTSHNGIQFSLIPNGILPVDTAKGIDISAYEIVNSQPENYWKRYRVYINGNFVQEGYITDSVAERINNGYYQSGGFIKLASSDYAYPHFVTGQNKIEVYTYTTMDREGATYSIEEGYFTIEADGNEAPDGTPITETEETVGEGSEYVDGMPKRPSAPDNAWDLVGWFKYFIDWFIYVIDSFIWFIRSIAQQIMAYMSEFEGFIDVLGSFFDFLPKEITVLIQFGLMVAIALTIIGWLKR